VVERTQAKEKEGRKSAGKVHLSQSILRGSNG